ncbi:MAG: hypothetical protein FWH51_03825 [Dehalococcoidia bacterium]|nr:hypothetical protein [Dehalococcoidia bacterium]
MPSFAEKLIDRYCNDLEMPDPLSVTDDRKDAVYSMTVLGKTEGKRVWQYICYATTRRIRQIMPALVGLATWEEELKPGGLKKAHGWAYERYFTVKDTPKGSAGYIATNRLALPLAG